MSSYAPARPASNADVPRSLTVAKALPWAATAGRLLLGAVFAYAALTKIADPAATVRSVRAYDLLPDGLATVVGRGLPSFELVLALLLFSGLVLRFAAAVTAGLLVVFLAGIISAAARGLRIDCGCFGSGGPTADPNYTGEIVRDLLLLAVAVGLALLGTSRLSLQPKAPVAPELPASSNRGAAGRVRSAQQRHLVAVQSYRRRNLVTMLVALLLLVAAPASAATVAEVTEPAPPVAIPATATARGGLVVGAASAKHSLVVFEDPQCPYCGEFERGDSAKALATAVKDGRVRVEYRMRSFVGPESVRAVAALAAAADEGRFAELHAELYANQPEEHSGGYSVDTLLALGKTVGLTSQSFVDAVRSQTYAPWARQIDDFASQDGNTSTPELRLDGKTLTSTTVFDAAALTKALA